MSAPRRRREPDAPEHRPKVRFAHLADEYAVAGKADSASVAVWLRRHLHPRIIVANGATVTPHQRREDS